MVLEKRYTKAYTITEIVTLLLAAVIFVLVSYGFFFASRAAISSIIISSVLYISYFGVLYYYICPYLLRKSSVRLVILYLIGFNIVSVSVMYLLFKYNVLYFPYPLDIYPPPITYKIGVFTILGLCIFLGAFGIYLIQNTYLLSIESYHLLQKSYQAEINSLRLQMNPHYISNSLNNLSHLIRKGNTLDAIVYNNELINLMKEQMKNVNSNTISIQDELNWLECYFQMEQQRLQYQFSYEIHVENNNLYRYQIPPMLLQPLVENSIIHGFNPAVFNGDGVISISIKEIENSIVCITVNDNGAGSKAVPIHPRERSSISTKNIIRRINLINEMKIFHINWTKDIHADGSSNTILIRRIP